jgi:hypothetical protein
VIPKTGVVYTVLYDVKKRERVKIYQYDLHSFGNSGVCPSGKYFLAINYARMARLRPVTGYKGSFDWTDGVAAPKDDGIAIINIKTGKKKILISFEQIAQGSGAQWIRCQKTEIYSSITPFGIEMESGFTSLLELVGNPIKTVERD